MEPFTIVEGPEAWRAAEYRGRDDWVTVLSPAHIAELDAAIQVRACLHAQGRAPACPCPGRTATRKPPHAQGRRDRAMHAPHARRAAPTPPPTSPPRHAAQPRPPQGVTRAGLDIEGNPHSVTRAAFPLPTLGPLLEGVRDEVVKGRGFAVIRGVPVDR